MKVASLADVKARLSAYIDESAKGPIVITRNGKAAAVLVAPEDHDDLERLLLTRSSHFQKILSASRASIKAGKGLSRDEFWKTVNKRAKRANKRKFRKVLSKIPNVRPAEYDRL